MYQLQIDLSADFSLQLMWVTGGKDFLESKFLQYHEINFPEPKTIHFRVCEREREKKARWIAKHSIVPMSGSRFWYFVVKTKRRIFFFSLCVKLSPPNILLNRSRTHTWPYVEAAAAPIRVSNANVEITEKKLCFLIVIFFYSKTNQVSNYGDDKDKTVHSHCVCVFVVQMDFDVSEGNKWIPLWN